MSFFDRRFAASFAVDRRRVPVADGLVAVDAAAAAAVGFLADVAHHAGDELKQEVLLGVGSLDHLCRTL